jgi:hypothetical protein
MPWQPVDMTDVIEFQGDRFLVDAAIAQLVDGGDVRLFALNGSRMPGVKFVREMYGLPARSIHSLKRLALLLAGHGLPDGQLRYYHRNGDPLDCRAENLEVVADSLAEMAARRVTDPATRNIQSLPSGRFRVRVYDRIKKVAVNAGTFDTLEEAQAFRDGISDLATSSHSR